MKDIYDVYWALIGAHPSGYVPIYKIRRSLGWSRERFDKRIVDLNQRDQPIVELHRGDPQRYTAAENADSLRLRGRTYRLLRWRSEVLRLLPPVDAVPGGLAP